MDASRSNWDQSAYFALREKSTLIPTDNLRRRSATGVVTATNVRSIGGLFELPPDVTTKLAPIALAARYVGERNQHDVHCVRFRLRKQHAGRCPAG